MVSGVAKTERGRSRVFAAMQDLTPCSRIWIGRWRWLKMKSNDRNELLGSTGVNGRRPNTFGLFGFFLIKITENFVFIFWAVFSLLAIYALMFDEQLVNFLAEKNKILQANIFIFSKINRGSVFDNNLANAHFLLMTISIPIQLIMLFCVPNLGIASGAQKKRKSGLLWVVVLFMFLLAVVLTIGPAVPARYLRILGEKPVIAISNYAITIAFSYLIRVAAIVLFAKEGESRHPGQVLN